MHDLHPSRILWVYNVTDHSHRPCTSRASSSLSLGFEETHIRYLALELGAVTCVSPTFEMPGFFWNLDVMATYNYLYGSDPLN